MAKTWIITEIINEQSDEESAALELEGGLLTVRRGNPFSDEEQISIPLADIKRLIELTQDNEK